MTDEKDRRRLYNSTIARIYAAYGAAVIKGCMQIAKGWQLFAYLAAGAANLAAAGVKFTAYAPVYLFRRAAEKYMVRRALRSYQPPDTYINRGTERHKQRVQIKEPKST